MSTFATLPMSRLNRRFGLTQIFCIFSICYILTHLELNQLYELSTNMIRQNVVEYNGVHNYPMTLEHIKIQSYLHFYKIIIYMSQVIPSTKSISFIAIELDHNPLSFAIEHADACISKKHIHITNHQ